jgi:hypothetical protein
MSSFATHLSRALAVVAVLATVLGVTQASAQTKRTQKLEAPVVQVTRVRPDVAELSIRNLLASVGARQEYQVISGPNAEGSPSSLSIGGVIQVGLRNVQGQYPIQLLPNSDYYVRVRNVKTSVNVSSWSSVFFRTPAQFETRPAPPANLRITQQTATQVTLVWDAPSGTAPSPTGFYYELFLNNQRTPIFQCGGAYVVCTEADFRTVTISRPTPGTTLTFGVTARDSDLNRSELASITVN